MDTIPSRCLLCLVKVEPSAKLSAGSELDESFPFPDIQVGIGEDEDEKPLEREADQKDLHDTTSTLQRQLDVIFLLRNVLRLPLISLKRYLKVRGNPEDWLVLCESCDMLMRKAKDIFAQLQRISKKYNEARATVEEKIRSTNLINEVDTKSDFILHDCRRAICRKGRSASTEICFLQGDRKARQLLKQRHIQVKRERKQDELTRELLKLEAPSSPNRIPFETLEEIEILNLLVEVEENDPLSTGEALNDQRSASSVSSSLVSYSSSDGSSSSSSEAEDDFKNVEEMESKNDLEGGDERFINRTLRKRKHLSFNLGSESETDEHVPKKPKSWNRKKKTNRMLVTLPISEDELANRVACHICHKMLKNEPCLKNHLKNVHNTKLTYTCPEEGCDKIFYKRKSFQVHLKSHEVKEKPICTICQKEYTTQYILDKHDLFIHRIVKPSTKNLKVYDCAKCDKRFPLKLNERVHSETCQGKPKAPLECDLCQIRCATPKDLRVHKRFKHSIILPEEFEDEANNDQEPSKNQPEPEREPDLVVDDKLPCPQCGKLFVGEYRLNRHLEKVHPAEQPRISCSMCPRIFKRTDQMTLHLAKCHNIGTEDYLCLACGKFCESKARRKRHVCGVDENPTFACPQCGYECRNLSFLKSHIAAVHEKRKDVACELCEYRTKNEPSLLRHKASMHNIGIKCKVEGCNRFFHLQTFLDRHMKKIHSEEEREKRCLCTICGKGFFASNALNRHIQVMHLNRESRPYKCESCGKGFPCSAYVGEHMKKVHKKLSRSATLS